MGNDNDIKLVMLKSSEPVIQILQNIKKQDNRPFKIKLIANALFYRELTKYEQKIYGNE